MKPTIIYEKTYPEIHYGAPENIPDDCPELPDEIFNIERLRKYCEEIIAVPVPTRIAKSETFIRTAIQLAEIYRIDVIIKRFNGHINVSYSFDNSLAMGQMIKLFRMAHDLGFHGGINGRDVTVDLDYYTHDLVQNGRVIFP
ncbi:MAG: hypothetical protein IJW40_00340 [Clostridia bacterium]|nr:hypothetical protein [Clostridia bacterium]